MNIYHHINRYRKFFVSNRVKENGDLDIIDKDRIKRHEFDNYLKNKKIIIQKIYHRTGLRYNIIDHKFKVYRIDFLNGYEVNPFFFNFTENVKNKKIYKINFKLNFNNILKFIINIVNQFKWRIYSIIKQENTIIELVGVDGSGKSFLAKNFSNLIKNDSKYEIFHLWKKNIVSKKKKEVVKPYQKKSYNLFLSYLKEFYIFYKILFFYFIHLFFSKRKKILIFERSLRDLIIDPIRYRLKHNPFFIETLLNFILKNSYTLYLDISFKLSKKRKNEIDYKKFISVNNNIKKYYLRNRINNSNIKFVTIKNK